MAAGDITVIGSDKSTEINTTSSTVQWADLDGAGLAANDTCVLFWEHSNAATETVTPTSQGFTQIDTVTDGTSVLTAYKKTCTGSETGSITVTTSVAGRKSLFGVVLRGALDVDILNTGGDAGTDANHTPPAATPTSAGCGALIALGEHSGTASAATPPAGYTEILEDDISGSGASFGYLAYKGSAGLLDKLTSGVAETPGNIVSNATGSNVTYMTLILTPAVSGLSGDATLAATDTITAAGSVGKAVGASLAATDTITAVGQVGRSTGASLAATDTITVAGAVGKSSGASVSETATITAAGAVGAATGASIAATATISADGVVGANRTAGASLDAVGMITAEGVVGQAQMYFTPPTVLRSQASPGNLWGRYQIPVGQSVVRLNGTLQTVSYPWIGELQAAGSEGTDWFLGGRTYPVSAATAAELNSAGYVTTT